MLHPQSQSDSDLSDDSDIDQLDLHERANGVEVFTSDGREDSFENDAKGDSISGTDAESANGENAEIDIDRANGVVEMEVGASRTQLDFDGDVDDELELRSFSSAMNHRRSMSATSSRAHDADDEAKSTSSDGTTESFDFGGLAGMVQMMSSHEISNGGVDDLNGAAGRLTGASGTYRDL